MYSEFIILTEAFIKLHQYILIELRLFYANFQYGMILSTSLSKRLNYHKKINFCLLSATLDLPIMNTKNQNKPNVCQSLVLKVYFQKKVLWMARFYLFLLYNNKNFGPTYKKSRFCVFKIQYGRFDKF